MKDQTDSGCKAEHASLDGARKKKEWQKPKEWTRPVLRTLGSGKPVTGNESDITTGPS